MIQDKTPSFRLYLHFILPRPMKHLNNKNLGSLFFASSRSACEELTKRTKTQLAAQIHQRDKQTGTNKLRKTDWGVADKPHMSRVIKKELERR